MFATDAMNIFRRLHQDGIMSHMPFLSPGGRGETFLLHSLAPAISGDHSPRWKLHWMAEHTEPHRISTGLPDEVVECSPAAWHDGEGWHLTFIAGGANDDPAYRLFRMAGPCLSRLGPPSPLRSFVRAGFQFRDRLVYADFEKTIHVRQPFGDVDLEVPGVFILRVAYRADFPDKLLITGQPTSGGEVFTIEYDLATGQQDRLECDGHPAYKCTILGDDVLYAHRTGEDFEARHIRSGLLARTPADVVRRVAPGTQEPAALAEGQKGCCGGSVDRSPSPVAPRQSGAGAGSAASSSATPCPRQNESWLRKGITALRVIESADVPDAIRTARDLACTNCPYRYIVRGKNYCGCCGCPEWNLGSVGSDLGYKNKKAAWECPRPVPAFGPWGPDSESLTMVD